MSTENIGQQVVNAVYTPPTGRKHVMVKTEFTALHVWPSAPDEVAFLRCPHRHIFVVSVAVEVKHGDRAVEFFMLKRDVDLVIRGEFLVPISGVFTWTSPGFPEKNLGMPVLSGSCEDMAEHIGRCLLKQGYCVTTVAVSEDNENTGVWLNVV